MYASGQEISTKCVTISDFVEHFASYPNGTTSTALRRAIRANEVAVLANLGFAKLGFANEGTRVAKPIRQNFKQKEMARAAVKRPKPEIVKATPLRQPTRRRSDTGDLPLFAVKASLKTRPTEDIDNELTEEDRAIEAWQKKKREQAEASADCIIHAVAAVCIKQSDRMQAHNALHQTLMWCRQAIARVGILLPGCSGYW